MKLMMIIMSDEDQEGMMQKLNAHQMPVTLISSTGEFLNYGETTLLLGIEDDRWEEAFIIMKQYMKEKYPSAKEEQSHGHIYVLNIDYREVKPVAVMQSKDDNSKDEILG